MLRAVGKAPRKLFDVQLAAGFCSNEYPSAYGSVVNKFLGLKVAKGEQRTDWRKRPLTDAQINYALEDVRHLRPLYNKLVALLTKHERLEWFEEEQATWQQEIVVAQGSPGLASRIRNRQTGAAQPGNCPRTVALAL